MEIFLVLAIVLLIIYTQWCFLQQLFAKKMPPGPWGLPIIGNLLQLGKQPHQTMAELAKHYGPLMTLRFGTVMTIVASSPEMAKEILRRNEKCFLDRPVPDVVNAQPNPEATIGWGTVDHRWHSRRRIVTTQLFTSHRLENLQELHQRKVEDLLCYIRRHSVSESSPVDIGKLAFATTLNLISNTVFSIDVIDPEFRSAQEFKNLVGTIMEDAGKPNLSDYFPILRRLDLQGMRHRIQPCYTRLHEIFDNIINKRLESRDLGSFDGDFLDVLLDQFDKNESYFNRDNIKPLILDLFIAGSDTASITTEWAMVELLRNPEILHKLQNELDGTSGFEGLDKSLFDINKLPYLQAVIKETLRLHPPAPLLLPYKAKNTIQISNFSIKKGSQVLVNTWSINRNPLYWKNPLSFQPDRFLGSNVDLKGLDFQFIPFGAGRRICPGLPLALRMVRLLIASLVHNFSWEFPEGVTADNIDMEEQFGVTLKKSVPLFAVPTIRRSQG